MKEIEFNLLDEKWILVRKSDCTVDELSLTDALLKSHEYVELAGELPTQDVAVLRLMLAVLHTVFSRYSPDGEEWPLEEPEDAEERWKELWTAGRLPEKPIRDYLESVHERFWIFHPERPFYQALSVNTDETASVFSASKLNSAIAESNNKPRLFASRSGEEKERLTNSEAARWLLHVNAFDDSSNERGKSKKINASSGKKLAGIGWLGNLGIIAVHGKNLFEDLLLNYIALNYGGNSVWEEEKPIWEEKVRSRPRVEIAMPDNLAALYTLQSRRVMLVRSEGFVTAYRICGGDFFTSENAFLEPMTIWRVDREASKGGNEVCKPKAHNYAAQMWREFSVCFDFGDGNHTPGIVGWINYIKKEGLIDKTRLISFRICSVQYDTMKSCYTNILSDSLTFHTDLITEVGEHWRDKIETEIQNCGETAKEVKNLAVNIEIAAGADDESAKKCAAVARAQEQFYYEIDAPFRSWLESIDPTWAISSEQERAAIRRWHETAKRIALRIGQELVESAGTAAIVGRTIEIEKKKGNKITVHYSAPDAYRYFKVKLNKIYPKEENND